MSFWSDLNLELCDKKGEWVRVVAAKPEEFLIACKNQHGIYIWYDIRTTKLRWTREPEVDDSHDDDPPDSPEQVYELRD
jgi:hypothetical protein